MSWIFSLRYAHTHLLTYLLTYVLTCLLTYLLTYLLNFYKVWEPAKISANRERVELEKVAAADGITEILPHDWRYYAEKVRNTKYNVDDNEIKPYFSLDNIVAAVFYVTHQVCTHSLIHSLTH